MSMLRKFFVLALSTGLAKTAWDRFRQKSANAASGDDLRRRHSGERGIHGVTAVRRAERESHKHKHRE